MLPGESGPPGLGPAPAGRTHRLKGFRFDGAVCGVCPLRSQCVAAAPGTGRTMQLHPQEALLQQARALQQSEAFAEYRQRRVVVEHRLARLVQLGIRQSRYFGRAKTRFQLYLAATAANLTLVGLLLRDVVINRDDVDGLVARLLTSDGGVPTGATKLGDLLHENADALGRHYVPALRRNFRR